MLPEVIYRFSATPVRMSMAFFIEMGKNNPEICMEPQKTLDSQSNLRNDNKAGAIAFPYFKL